jgi:hypothetical protein
VVGKDSGTNEQSGFNQKPRIWEEKNDASCIFSPTPPPPKHPTKSLPTLFKKVPCQ